MISLSFGALAGFVLLLFDNANLPSNDHVAGIIAYVSMNLMAFVLALLVRHRPWMWGPSLKFGQILVVVPFTGGSFIAAAERLFVLSAILTLPLLLAGFLGHLMAGANSRRRNAYVLIAFGCLIASEILLWEILRIDDCLDAGGSWNYGLSACEH